MGKLEEQLMRGEDPFGFTDEQARKLIDQHNAVVLNKAAITYTQHGIIKYMEAMAQVMAEAAIASEQANGDTPHVAVYKWTQIVSKRAHELVNEKKGTSKQIEKCVTIESDE
jgi:hypothetical protein